LPNTTITKSTSTSPGPTPFWPTAVLPKLPAEFSNIPEESLACWNSWANYQLRSQVPNPGIIATDSDSLWRSVYETPKSYFEDYSYCSETVNEVPVGLTTLCDQVPRVSRFERTTSWTLHVWTYNYTETETASWVHIPGTTISGYENWEPSCTVAENYEPLCETVNSAYSWWRSQASQTPATTTVAVTETLAAPSCMQLVPTPTGAKPTCAMEFSSHEVWYWPTAAPSGTDFCNSSWAPVTATPTIPGKANTAIVSGKTLTSPSVYYFIKSVTVHTLAGTRRRADESFIRSSNVWLPSTTINPQTILTAKQLESDIISYTYSYANRPHANVGHLYNKDFKVIDISTMRSRPYFSNRERSRDGKTIVQEMITPSLAVPALEVATQNGLFADCEWSKTESRANFPSDYPAAVEVDVPSESFFPILTPGQSTHTKPVPTVSSSSSEVRVPNPPACTL